MDQNHNNSQQDSQPSTTEPQTTQTEFALKD